jgi:hypothetical protein
MVGLLKEVKRERRFLIGIFGSYETLYKSSRRLRRADENLLLIFLRGEHVNLVLKALSRCRSAHTEIAEIVVNLWARGESGAEDGFIAIGGARSDDNLKCVVDSLLGMLRIEGRDANHLDVESAAAAASALALVRNVKAVRPLVDTLKYSAERMSALGDCSLSKKKKEMYFDAYRDLHEAVVYALEQLPGDAATEPLIELLSHNNEWVRGKAAEALGEIGNPRTVPSLQKLLDDPGWLVHDSAQIALEKIEDRTGSKSR